MKAANSKIRQTRRPSISGCLPRARQTRPRSLSDVTIGFENGAPVSLNGQHKLSGVALLEELNKIGGEHGIGRIDLVENRFVGMKSRGCYETPGGTDSDGGSPRTRSAHARPHYAALQAESWRSITPRWSTTAFGLLPCANRWMRFSRRSRSPRAAKSRCGFIKATRAGQPQKSEFAV